LYSCWMIIHTVTKKVVNVVSLFVFVRRFTHVGEHANALGQNRRSNRLRLPNSRA
jgi:ribose/xylose/arabinose/galactoside ABC-type transport system permease subunit